MNSICTDQNAERQLDRLAAQRALYSKAKRTFAWHAVLSTIAAFGLSLGALFCSGLKPYAVLWGVALAILDILWLTPRQKKLREEAATIQESFDCAVLGLPWQPLKVGKPVDQETVVEHAAVYRRREPSFDSLRDWYPAAVCHMPLFLARVVCQRVNAWWDARQRRRYAFCLIAAVIVLLLAVFAVGLIRHMELADLLLTAVGPLSAGIVLALRQYKENAEAAARLEKLKDHARDLWARAGAGAPESELAAASRVLQDELFDNRKRNVPVFDWIYWLLRFGHEVQMQESAADLVRELEAARGAAT
jgi:hypothetical protein